MDRKRIIAVAAIALALALVAAVGAYRYLASRQQMVENARLQTVGIVVALVDIPLGSTINSNQVGISAWPKDHYPKDAISKPADAIGRVVFREFLKGEPIVESRLVPVDRPTGLLSLKVPSGMRAFSVKVNEVVGVGGFIAPDSRVDVVVTTELSGRRQEQFSKIFLEDVQVLAAGQTIEQKENKPVTVNTVTLAVTPEDAEKLALASNDGKIQLVLRSFADNAAVMTRGVDKVRLLSSYRAAPVETESRRPAGTRRVTQKAPKTPPPKKTFSVEVIKGTKRAEENFE